MRVLSVCLSILSLPLMLSGQTGAIAVPAGQPPDVTKLPATMDLIAKAPGAHPGKIWVRSTDEGLHIWGKVQVNDDDLHWPKEKSQMLASDHVEIWLSGSPEVEMPLVGYGNQFGEIDLNNAADCAPTENGGGPGDPRVPNVKDCERWYNDQIEYRRQFERLFTRQWLVAGPGSIGQQTPVFEDFAASAWANLNASFFEQELPKPLQPHGSEGILSEFNEDSDKQVTEMNASGAKWNRGVVTGYNFHFFIPWSEFPPAQQLDLRDLWLMVDVFGAALDGKKMGPLSTTSAQRVWGKPSSFNHLVLQVPRQHEITPCRAPNVEKDMYGNPQPAWYFPLNGKGPLTLGTVYDIENPAGGYMYDPAGVSPIFKESDHFWKTLPGGAAVCGPQLAYRNGDIARTSSFFIGQQYFENKALPDGWLLVRTGPDMSTQSRFGSGQCGSCPVVDFDIYAVSPAGEIANALSISDEFTGFEDQAADGDFAIASDWSKITFYEKFVTYTDDGKGGEKDNWNSTSYCLQGHTYAKCGDEKNVKPPNPPNFKLDEQ
jgi:hypothetical protein